MPHPYLAPLARQDGEVDFVELSSDRNVINFPPSAKNAGRVGHPVNSRTRLSGCVAGALVIFYVLAQGPYNSFLAAYRQLQFLVEAGKSASVVGPKGVEHGSGQVGKGLQGKLQFLLQVRVLLALIGHNYRERFDAGSSVASWRALILHLRQLTQLRSRHAKVMCQLHKFPGESQVLFCVAHEFVG